MNPLFDDTLPLLHEEGSARLSRRNFLTRAAAIGAAALGAGTILAACDGPSGQRQPPGGQGSGDPQADPEAACDDLSGLTEGEKNMRINQIKQFKYVEESPYPDKICANCQFWVEPVGGTRCGGCQLIQGPIEPDGYCTSWAKKAG